MSQIFVLLVIDWSNMLFYERYIWLKMLLRRPQKQREICSQFLQSQPSILQYFANSVSSVHKLAKSDDDLKNWMAQNRKINEIDRCFKNWSGNGLTYNFFSQISLFLTVLQPKWLSSNIIGHLASPDFIRKSRSSGFYTSHELKSVTSWEAVENILPILESLGLCAKVSIYSTVVVTRFCLKFRPY